MVDGKVAGRVTQVRQHRHPARPRNRADVGTASTPGDLLQADRREERADIANQRLGRGAAGKSEARRLEHSRIGFDRKYVVSGMRGIPGRVRGSALKALENAEDEEKSKCIYDLMDAVDEYIPVPNRAVDKPFLMPIEDIFTISGRGTVATGRVETGIIKVGEEVEIVGFRPTAKTVITGVEMFRKLLDEGQAGDNIGALLRGTKRDEIERGQVLAKPGSITPHTTFKAEVYILTKDEGGRHTPFFNGYRPQFYFRTTDVTGIVTLPKGVEMVMPGDNVTFEVVLITAVAMKKELRFAIREGGRTVGAGVVSEVVE